MKRIELQVGDWYVDINLKEREVVFTNVNMPKLWNRAYDLPNKKDIDNLQLLDDTLYLYFEDKTYYDINLSDNQTIIIDEYNQDEHIQEIGCIDINDDEN